MAGGLSLGTIPSKGRGTGAARNARWVQIGGMKILFSYGTSVAFSRGDVSMRRESISQTTSQHLSAAGAADWPVKEFHGFDEALQAQLLTEVTERSDFQEIATGVVFDLTGWLREIDAIAWRRVTKLREAVGLLAMEAFRQLTLARHETSEFSAEIKNTLAELIAEEKSHREQIAAKAKPPSSRRSARDKGGSARR